MNMNDFKIWFEGFCDAIEGVPTKEQWNIIKNKVNSSSLTTSACREMLLPCPNPSANPFMPTPPTNIRPRISDVICLGC